MQAQGYDYKSPRIIIQDLSNKDGWAIDEDDLYHKSIQHAPTKVKPADANMYLKFIYEESGHVNANFGKDQAESKQVLFNTPQKGCKNEQNVGENWGADEDDMGQDSTAMATHR